MFMPENAIIFFEIHSIIQRGSVTLTVRLVTQQMWYTMGLTAYRYVQSTVWCLVQLVMQELVMRLELYQLWAKQCPVDLTILFIHHKLLCLNISVLTHAKLPTYLTSYDISGQYSISWWKNIKNLSIYKNRLYKNFCTKLFEFFFWLNGIHLL